MRRIRIDRRARLLCAVVVATVIMASAAPLWALDDTSNFIINVLVPGRGQAQSGHYTKAALLGGAGVASYVGLYATQINYNRSVEEFDRQKATYLGFRSTLSSGGVVSLSEINSTFDSMTEAFDQSESRYTTRNVFIGALAVVYTLNFIDLIRSEDDTGELDKSAVPSMSLRVEPDAVMVIRTFSF